MRLDDPGLTSIKSPNVGNARTLAVILMQTHHKSYEESLAEAIVILNDVKNHIKDNSDLTWVYYETVDDMRNEIDKYIVSFQNGSIKFLNEVNTHFAPTAAYQEHSMANDWTIEYHKLAERFDKIYDDLKKYG